MSLTIRVSSSQPPKNSVWSSTDFFFSRWPRGLQWQVFPPTHYLLLVFVTALTWDICDSNLTLYAVEKHAISRKLSRDFFFYFGNVEPCHGRHQSLPGRPFCKSRCLRKTNMSKCLTACVRYFLFHPNFKPVAFAILFQGFWCIANQNYPEVNR